MGRPRFNEPPPPRCQWQGCTNQNLVSDEVPICTRHAILISDAWATRQAQDHQATRTLVPNPVYRGPLKEATRLIHHPAHPGDVYYLLIGDHIKIGWSKNVYRRLTSYPPDANLLGTEEGAKELERERHQQFHAYLAHGREWFLDAQEIRDHIATLPASFYADHKRMRRGAGNQRATIKPAKTGRWR